jgi:hypothetical protein
MFLVGSAVAGLVAVTATTYAFVGKSPSEQKSAAPAQSIPVSKIEPTQVETVRVFSAGNGTWNVSAPPSDPIASKLNSQPVAAVAPAVPPKAPHATSQVAKPQAKPKSKATAKSKQPQKPKQAQKPPQPPKPVVTGSL